MSVPNSYWKALFDFANRTGAEDAVNQPDSTGEQLRAMSPQDREWLENAMKEYVNEADPIRQMKDCLEKCMRIQTQTPSDNQIDVAVDALERLQDLCSDLDLAKDFFNIGGVRLLPFLLSNANSDIKKETLGLIGELSQNHPYCQEQLQKVEVLPVLLNILQYENEDALRSRAVFAISCLIRGHSDLEQEFVNADGLTVLSSALAASAKERTYRTGAKIAFLLQNLANHPAFRDLVSNLNLDKIGLGLILGVNEIRECTLASAFNERILALLCKVCTQETWIEDGQKQLIKDVLNLDEDECYEDQKVLAGELLEKLGCEN